MAKSIAIIDGDILLDSRGKFVTSEGRMKVASAVNYYLSTSSHIQQIFKNTHSDDNEDIIRWAIINTMNDIIEEHKKAYWLPDGERVKNIGYLSVTTLSKTSFSFTLEVSTFSNDTFNIALERL